MTDQANPVLEARGIVKVFGQHRALDGVDFAVRPGEVHALLGENGAGKSTLIKTLAGIHKPDEGEILFKGEPYAHRPPKPNENHHHNTKSAFAVYPALLFPHPAQSHLYPNE